MRKKVIMSRKEAALIILTVIGALDLYAWQTYRMAQHMGTPPAKQDVPAASTTTRSK